jgi:SpoVK/Ycf46/Vps4 family AAA+-type ATPase
VGKTWIFRALSRRLQATVCCRRVEAAELLVRAVEGRPALEELLRGAGQGQGRPVVLLVDDLDSLLPEGDDRDDDEGWAGSEAAGVVRALTAALPSASAGWVLATRENVGAAGATGGGGRMARLLALQGSLYDRVVEVGAPDAEARAAILGALLAGVPLEAEGGPADREALVQWLAGSTASYVARDLVALCEAAALESLARGEGGVGEGGQPAPVMVSRGDLLAARASVAPSQLSGLDVVGPGAAGGLSWESVGGYEGVKARLKQLVTWPWQHAATFARMGVSAVPGILLHGPSGCGKSMLAQVIAAEARASFVHVHATDIFSAYLGESEARLRAVFARARRAAPCILFLDELDAMAAQRGHGEEGGDASSVYARVLSTLLNEMDGIGGRAAQVLVLAATNRIEAVDAALLRPGRLQEQVLVPLPDPHADLEPILRVACRGVPLAPGVDLQRVAQEVLGPVAGRKSVTPAQVVALCREAAMESLREDRRAEQVDHRHFQRAAARLWGAQSLG